MNDGIPCLRVNRTMFELQHNLVIDVSGKHIERILSHRKWKPIVTKYGIEILDERVLLNSTVIDDDDITDLLKLLVRIDSYGSVTVINLDESFDPEDIVPDGQDIEEYDYEYIESLLPRKEFIIENGDVLLDDVLYKFDTKH